MKEITYLDLLLRLIPWSLVIVAWVWIRMIMRSRPDTDNPLFWNVPPNAYNWFFLVLGPVPEVTPFVQLAWVR